MSCENFGIRGRLKITSGDSLIEFMDTRMDDPFLQLFAVKREISELEGQLKFM
jgi:hypothetical protein